MKRLAILALLGALLTASFVWSQEPRPSGSTLPPATKDTAPPASSGGGASMTGTPQSGTSSSAKGTLNPDLDKVGKVLVTFLVLSVLFEVALTPLFNWRRFIKYLDGGGWKTPITIGLAFLIFWKYELDIVSDLLVALGRQDQDSAPNFGGRILSALVIAGGSSGVLEIFRTLGIREKAQERQKRVTEIQKKAMESGSSG